jgi:hypothetical protein
LEAVDERNGLSNVEGPSLLGSLGRGNDCEERLAQFRCAGWVAKGSLQSDSA